MKNYYNLAVVLNGLVTGCGAINGFDAIRQKLLYNDNLTMACDIALVAVNGILLHYINKIKERDEAKSLSVILNSANAGKTLENKVEGKQMLQVIGFVPEESVGARQYYKPILNEQSQQNMPVPK